MIEIHVDRLAWNRGNIGPDEVKLYDDTNYPEQYDIVGFIIDAMGSNIRDLWNCERPSEVFLWGRKPDWSWPLLNPDGTDSPFTEMLIEYNDDPSLSEDEREELITRLFHVTCWPEFGVVFHN